MSIRTVENPVDGQTVTIAEGIIDAVSFRDVEADKYGNNVSVGVRIGDDWINLKIKGKEGYDPSLRINAGTRSDPDWQEVVAGDEVKINVNPSEYNGKTYYYSGVSKIHLIKKGAGQATKKSTESYQKSASGGSYKKDMSGIQVGHSINGAAALLGAWENAQELIDAAKSVHDVSEVVKKQYAENHPEMSEYDVGAASGNAVLNACRVVENIDQVKEVAFEILSEVVPDVLAYVKENKEEKKVPTKKAAPKKSAKKPVAKKQEAVNEESSFDDNPFADEDDDSAPF